MEKNYIKLVDYLAKYLENLHRRKLYLRITPGCIGVTSSGKWSVRGKPSNVGSTREDIRYLGATLYELVTNITPTVDFIMDGILPFPGGVVAKYPARLLRIIERCLLPYGLSRYNTMADVIRDIKILRKEIKNAGVRGNHGVGRGFRFSRIRELESKGEQYNAHRRTKKMLWEINTPGPLVATPWINSTNIFLVTKNGVVEAIDRLNGETVWVTSTDSSVESSPVIYGDTLYFGSDEGKFYGLNILTGKIVWEQWFGNSFIRSSPTVVKGRMLFGSGSGEFYCLSLERRDLVWSFETGGSIFSSAVSNGKEVWFGSDDGCLYSISLTTGKLNWRFATGGKIRSSPVYQSGNIVVGSFDHFLYCIGGKNGKIVWKTSTNERIYSSPATCGEEGICVGSNDGNVYMVRFPDGSIKWRFRSTKPFASSPLVLSRTIYIGSDSGILYGLDKLCGRKVWEKTMGSKLRVSPSWFQGCLYFASMDKLCCIRVKGD